MGHALACPLPTPGIFTTTLSSPVAYNLTVTPKLLLFALLAASGLAQTYDVVIRNGHIVDGRARHGMRETSAFETDGFNLSVLLWTPLAVMIFAMPRELTFPRQSGMQE